MHCLCFGQEAAFQSPCSKSFFRKGFGFSFSIWHVLWGHCVSNTCFKGLNHGFVPYPEYLHSVTLLSWVCSVRHVLILYIMCGPGTVCSNPALGTNINGILIYLKLYCTSIQIVNVHIYSFWIKPVMIFKSLVRSWFLSVVAYFYCLVLFQQD